MHDPNPVGVLSKKTSTCQDNFKIWNHETFGHIQITLGKKMKELNWAEEASMYKTSPDLIKKLRDEIQGLKAKEEIMWKQRSRVNWLRERDQNTRYFHCRANQRNKHNYILGFEDDNGLWNEDESRMGGLVEDYFTNIFTSSNPFGFDDVLNGMLPIVTPEMNAGLLRPYTAKEVHKALN